MAKLNEMVREFRNSVNQSVEGLALLLGMPPEDYARLEEDWIPPDDVLERPALGTVFLALGNTPPPTHIFASLALSHIGRFGRSAGYYGTL